MACKHTPFTYKKTNYSQARKDAHKHHHINFIAKSMGLYLELILHSQALRFYNDMTQFTPPFGSIVSLGIISCTNHPSLYLCCDSLANSLQYPSTSKLTRSSQALAAGRMFSSVHTQTVVKFPQQTQFHAS